MAVLSPEFGVLLVGHGTRHAAGRESFLTLAGLVSEALVPRPLEPAFLELAQPTIAGALGRLLDRGARQIVVAPLLLFAAGHARHDLPAAVEAARQEHALPELPVRQAGHLGLHPAIAQLSRQRFTEVLQGRPVVPRESTCLLLVGRGSSDPEAIAEMHELARLRATDSEIAQCRVAFVAVARPSVAESLTQIAAQDWRRMIIQPHLLFRGEVLDSLETEVRLAASQHPHQEWIIAPLLGADFANEPAQDLLVRAIADRIHAALKW